MFLEIKGLTKNFGGLIAINNFDLGVNQLEIIGLIGPNGAGKTTLFNLITGVYRSNGGTVIFGGKDITNISPHTVASLGIGRTFQLNPLFNEFTVLENVSASFHLHPKSHLWDIFFNTPTYRKNEAYINAQSLEVLRIVGLNKVKDELARNLPYGYQKMLGIARALATQPKLLLLDEPLGGMNPSEIELCLNRLRKLRQDGMTILIVEHNMQILDLCDRIAVISFGQKICEGSPKEVRENEEVISAYFGGENVA
jgi:ABC-type branched-chain amino acid transport systems, ATPase component